MPTGELDVSHYTLHTTAAPLVSVQHEAVHADLVRRAGANSSSTAYLNRWAHRPS